MSENKEVVKKEGLSIRVLILLIVLVALVIPKTVMVNWVAGQEEGGWGGTGTEWGFMPLGIFFIIAVFMSFLGDKAFTKSEMALFTGLAAFASVLVSHSYLLGVATMSIVLPNLVTLPNYDRLMQMIPDFMVVKNRALVSGVWTGGATIPVEIVPYMLWEMFYMILVGGIIIVLASILQRKFIYEDRLPFPTVLPAVVAVDLYSQRELFKNKWIWLGFLFGVIYMGPMTINMFYPLIPREHVFGRIPLDTILAPIFAPYHIQGWWFIDPMTIVWYTIMPMDVLVSMFVLDLLVFWIYPAIATMTGLMAPGVSAWSYYWGDVPGGIAWLQMVQTGVWIGIGLWILFTARKYITDSLKRAIKGIASPYPDDVSDRILWGTLGILVILWLGVWVTAGANILLLIFTLLLFLVTMIGNTWVQAFNLEWLASPFTSWTGNNIVWQFGQTIGAYSNPSLSLSALTARAMPNAFPASNPNWGGTLPSLFAYKLAETSSVKPKYVFYGLFITLVATAVVGVPIVTAMLYKYGISTILTRWGSRGELNPVMGMANNSGSGVFAPFVNWSSWKWLWTFIGIVLPILVFILRERYTWFFIHPAALMLWPICYGIFKSLPALLIKVAVIRIGGAKVYENTWVRIVTGFIIGVLVMDLIAMYALAFKYF
ncbi:MAG: DUF6785 family protein [Thermoproteota archaeon]